MIFLHIVVWAVLAGFQIKGVLRGVPVYKKVRKFHNNTRKNNFYVIFSRLRKNIHFDLEKGV